LRTQADFPSFVTEETTQEPVPEGEDQLKKVLEVLMKVWERRGAVLKAALAGGLLALVIAFLLPKKYVSTTQLMPPDKGHGNLASFAKLLGDQAIGSLAAEAMGVQMPGAAFIQVLRSRTVEDELVQEFDLRRVYKKKLWKDARKELARNTDIAEDRKSGVISITVTARSRELAANLARRYVQELNEVVSQLDASAAHRERVFIEARLKEVKADLDRDSRLLSQFSSRTETFDPKEQGKTMVEAAARLQGELMAAESELSGLRQVYGPQNARVRASEGKIAELRRNLKALQGSSDEELDYPSIRKLPLVGLQYGELYRNVRIQEAIYESLTKQYEMAKVEEARDIPSVRVLDEADVPEVKSSPKYTPIVLLGFLLGAVIAAGAVAASHLWGTTSDESLIKRLALQLSNDIAQDVRRLPFVRNRGVVRAIDHAVESRKQEAAAGR
jgi:uncharacterized protein involved in exopolysaccharide biosynthesis